MHCCTGSIYIGCIRPQDIYFILSINLQRKLGARILTMS
uniref:Uncharacterized protein n=1 Tax=Rhizophora mucronata TaxID=61149 RepID=A0A2P2PPW8_RHIMU